MLEVNMLKSGIYLDANVAVMLSVILERPRVSRAVADFTSPEDSVNCQCNCPVQVVDCSKTTQPTLQPQCMLLFYHS